MIEDSFGIETFNLISDDNNYYLFRALNVDDQKDIDVRYAGILKIHTNKQRFPENDKYATNSEISLEEVWNHTKSVNSYKGTSCISLSSNANVSLDYGSRYGHKYIMVKIPKVGYASIYNAGQYMISELNRILDQAIQALPKDSDVLTSISEIDGMTNNTEIKSWVADRFSTYRSSGKYTTRDSLTSKDPIRGRFIERQAFTEEQQTEYSKLLAKLTILEITGNIPRELLSNINVSSLLSTIGSEFSNREFLHYGELSSKHFVPISKFNIDIFAILQMAKEQGVSEEGITKLERKIIDFTNKGYKILSRDGHLYYSNGKNEIPLNIEDDNIIINDDSLLVDNEMLIDEAFEKTNGTISYTRAKTAANFLHNLSVAQRKTQELANVLKTIIQDEELNSVIDEIASRSISINDKIITRKNGRGIQLSESVNLNINNVVSLQEQTDLYSSVKDLSADALDSIIYNNGVEIEQEIYNRCLIHEQIDTSKTREERLNKYYAEAIIDGLKISNIYRRAIRDKSFTEEERNYLLSLLESVDCKRLFNSFIRAGVSENEVSGYIFNLLATNGYKGYNLEELSKAEELDDLISTNVNNGNLRGHVYASVLDDLRGIKDNNNIIENTLINLRDYQQEAVDNVDEIFAAGKRFAGVVLPTGAGKSFVAMAEMLKNKDKNIVYVAPQVEILNQVQRHILKYIAKVEVLTDNDIEKLKIEQGVNDAKNLVLPEGKILPSQVNEYIKKEFPHLKMYCYQGLSAQSDDELTEEQLAEKKQEERELQEALKNADADLIIFDELHRIGAKTWSKFVEQLIKANEHANILGITATPVRDADKIDTMQLIAKMVGTYTDDEIGTESYLAYYMDLVDAIQRGLVIEPEIVAFDFMLQDTEQYKEILDMIENEKDETKRNELLKIKSQIDEMIDDSVNVSKRNKNSISEKEIKQIGKIIKDSIRKVDGRYIVFLPQHQSSDGLSLSGYFDEQEKLIKEILSEIDADPEVYRLSSDESKADNNRAINNFENSTSNHIKIILAINKLNEGVHVDGINGEIMLRRINDGHVILYMQQLGRIIFAIDPNVPISEDDIPIVYDVYNNYLTNSLDVMMKKKTPKSEFEILKEIVEWIDKHGYYPDINSEDINEARKAINLKKIQTKYKKYIDGIYNPRLSKSDLDRISQLMTLANSIELFSQDIGARIIPPGEKDIGEVQLFKVTANQKRFLELYKSANKIVGNTTRHGSNKDAKLRDIIHILSIINSYDIFINNSLIKDGDTLKSVIEKCPEEYREALEEDLADFDEEYPIGQEFNFAKVAYRQSKYWPIFKEIDVRDLYAYGIYEDIDLSYDKNLERGTPEFNAYNNNKIILQNEFVVYGPKEHRGLNIKTGTLYDEYGNDLESSKTPYLDVEKLFSEQLAILRAVLKYLPDGYSLVNDGTDSNLPNATIETIIGVYSKEHKLKSVFWPLLQGIHLHDYALNSIKEYIVEVRKFLKSHLKEMNRAQVIEYKKLGILPLKLDENSIDTDTKMPKEYFGKNINEHKVLGSTIISKTEFDEIKKILIEMRNKYAISFPNKSIDDLPDDNLYNVGYRKSSFTRKLRKDDYLTSFNVRQNIIKAQAYLQNRPLSANDTVKYKQLRFVTSSYK